MCRYQVCYHLQINDIVGEFHTPLDVRLLQHELTRSSSETMFWSGRRESNPLITAWKAAARQCTTPALVLNPKHGTTPAFGNLIRQSGLTRGSRMR